jgi:hypothetical protein
VGWVGGKGGGKRRVTDRGKNKEFFHHFLTTSMNIYHPSLSISFQQQFIKGVPNLPCNSVKVLLTI